jgi:hypothetical protein
VSVEQMAAVLHSSAYSVRQNTSYFGDRTLM